MNSLVLRIKNTFNHTKSALRIGFNAKDGNKKNTMKEIHVHSYSPLHGEKSVSTTIIIQEPLEFSHVTQNLDELMANFKREAQIVFDALVNALPQGTTDQLLLLLLESRASYYIGKPGTPHYVALSDIEI